MSNNQDNKNQCVINFLDRVLNTCDRLLENACIKRIDLLIQTVYDVFWNNNKLDLKLDVSQTKYFLTMIDRYKDIYGKDDLVVHYMRIFCGEREKIAAIESDNPFLSFQHIDFYLNSYYSLLSQILYREDQTVRESSNDENSLLWNLLHLDMKENRVSMFNPIVLNEIRKMYNMVRLYTEREVMFAKDNKLISFLDKEVIMQKTIHSSRWIMMDEKRNPQHVSISTYMEENSNDDFYIPYRNMNTYSSYEGIGELRTGGKIIHELTRWVEQSLKKSTSISKFRVALVGDINLVPFLDLLKYLDGMITKKEKLRGQEINLAFTIFTNNCWQSDINICLKEINYKNLQSVSVFCVDMSDDRLTTNIKQLFEENELVMMLDSVNLYTPLKAQFYLSVESIKQRYVMGDFETPATADSIDICKNNYLDELYKIMTCYAELGAVGEYKNQINLNNIVMFEKIINEYSELNVFKSLYVYMSDIETFVNSDLITKKQVRIERYNQKEIGIVRFATGEKVIPSLPSVSDKNNCYITFDLLQLVKHLCLTKRKVFMEMLQKEFDLELALDEFVLSDLYVAVDYLNWREKINVFCYAKNREYEDFLTKVIEKLICPLLYKESFDLFKQYYYRTFVSILYGNAKSIQDMFFLHLMVNKTELLGPVGVPKKPVKKSILDNIDENYKFANKANIEHLLKIFDLTSEKYVLDTALIRYKESINNNDEEDVLKTITNICENMNYTQSRLYENTKEVKK